MSKARRRDAEAKKVRTLLLDLETAPNIVTSHDLYRRGGLTIPYQGILQEKFVICASWKWLGERKIYTAQVRAEPIFPFDNTRDLPVVRALHKVLQTADVVVAHNGDSFDIPWIHSRVAFYKMSPLHPFVQVDTRKIARRKFRFNTNRLDYLGEHFGIGRKIKTDHDLWMGCLNGDAAAISEMVRYNKRDVYPLLEKVYERLAPYVKPAVNALHLNPGAECPACGKGPLGSKGMMWKGTRFRRLQCQACGSWCKQNPQTKAISV